MKKTEFEFAFPKDDPTAIPTCMSANTKTDARRRFCILRGEDGIVTKDLTAFLADNRLDNNPGFASNFIFRMANTGELFAKNGRLVATRKMRDAIVPFTPLEMPK
jgi:hypothetical protein